MAAAAFDAAPVGKGAADVAFGAFEVPFAAASLTFGAPPLTFGASPLTFGAPPITFSVTEKVLSVAHEATETAEKAVFRDSPDLCLLELPRATESGSIDAYRTTFTFGSAALSFCSTSGGSCWPILKVSSARSLP